MGRGASVTARCKCRHRNRLSRPSQRACGGEGGRGRGVAGPAPRRAGLQTPADATDRHALCSGACPSLSFAVTFSPYSFSSHSCSFTSVAIGIHVSVKVSGPHVSGEGLHQALSRRRASCRNETPPFDAWSRRGLSRHSCGARSPGRQEDQINAEWENTELCNSSLHSGSSVILH